MKRTLLVPVFALLVASALPIYAAGLKCTGANGKASCTASQIGALNAAIVTGTSMHKPLLLDVKGVTPGKNGTLNCTQTNGSACTDAQLSAIIGLASSAHSPDGPITITKEMDMSSPAMAR